MKHLDIPKFFRTLDECEVLDLKSILKFQLHIREIFTVLRDFRNTSNFFKNNQIF